MSNTPDLDAFFGPKEETEMPELRPYKYEWRCEDAPEFVRWAVLKFGNLTLSSPGSLLNLIPAWQKRDDDKGFGIEVTV